ncbi:MAG: hypothetical protein H8E70_05555 [Candidatus Marinimicrobia bacterium]|nr:hypothetical protein [Candidatus Neomarinimicrobiota bacterium]
MKKILAFIFLFSCADKPVVKPDFDFSRIETIVIYPTPDFRSFSGSGSIINKSIVYHLMNMGINIVERETTPALIKEASLSQTGITQAEIDVKMTSSDFALLCTLTEFKDHQVFVVPITIRDRGSSVTTVETIDEPIITKDQSGNDNVHYETTTTETITTIKGSLTERESIEYVSSRVGMTVQLLNASNGDVLWTNTYWYSSISLTNAVNECVYGALRPLKKLLK